MAKRDNFTVPVEKLRRKCTEEELLFCETTEDIPPLDGFVGQERAVRAMRFGLSISAPGYNIYMAGSPGTGKSTYAQAVVSQAAVKGTVPDDWCYINNFDDPDRPLAVSLPAGKGLEFQKEMGELLADLRAAIPKAFESADYEQKKESVIQYVQQEMAEHLHQIEEESAAAGFSMNQTSRGFVFVPLKDGKAMLPEEYEALPYEEQRAIDEKGRRLQKKLDETFHTGRLLEKQAKVRIADLEKQIALFATGPLFDRLIEKYSGFPNIVNFLEMMRKDVGKNLEQFKNPAATAAAALPAMLLPDETEIFYRYKVNLFVNNSACAGAPVISEPNSQYYNLFGKIEYRSQVLALSTNFTMIKAGAIHRANGGYLILQAKDVLSDPFAWDTLKKALKYRQAVVENIGEQYRLLPTATLRPEPIPLNVKVILIGSQHLYHLLYNLDEDFQKLFKVKVDFDTEMPRNSDNLRQYASFVSSVCRREGLPHFSRTALAELVDYGTRLAGHQDKLSTRFNEVIEIVYEAASWGKAEGAEYVTAAFVRQAIEERVYRSNRLEEKIQEMIRQDKILIDTEKEVTGQVNGLSIIDVGDYFFGRPSRITARTYIGRGGVINIERETRMSGNIHSKGVLTLAGYLGGRFAQLRPLSLTAQITFEQNYEGVEGDSAASAELYAILSSLSGLPVKQSLAVTGSVDQYGRIQPVGGVTEKIEGFFSICKARGLTGEHGVIIPWQNIDNSNLKKEIVTAVERGEFRIFAVKTIEEGIEILTGVPAGEMQEDRDYPEGSVFSLIERKLKEFGKVIAGENDQKAGKRDGYCC